MACDTGAKPIEENEIVLDNENNNEIKKEKNMSSSLVLRKVQSSKWMPMIQKQVTM
jgi:peroxiredoxin (alkyl hydroperoxide reductase subunit C)